MSKSIISNDHTCIICKTSQNLHKHHIYYGTANRKKSEEHGCWCWLCANHHNMSPHGVHQDHDLDLEIKKMCQEILEKDQGWSRMRFIETFGKSYL